MQIKKQMAKQKEIERISPGKALRSMQAFNEAVVMLAATCKMALDHNLVNDSVAESMRTQLAEVNKFYQESD